MFYKIRLKIIFVKMGLRSGTLDNNILENQIKLYSEYWFWCQIIYSFPSLSLFFSCKSKDRISFESERKQNDPRPRGPKGRPLNHSVHDKLYCVPRHWESCMWKSQQTWPGNQPTYIFMPQDWFLEIVTSWTHPRLILIVRLFATAKTGRTMFLRSPALREHLRAPKAVPSLGHSFLYVILFMNFIYKLLIV